MGSSVMWFEITSTDPDRARTFYTQLFGWTGEAPPELGGYACSSPRGHPPRRSGEASVLRTRTVCRRAS